MATNQTLLTTGLASETSVTTTAQYFALQSFDSFVSVQAEGGKFVSWLSDDDTVTSAPAGAAEWLVTDFGQHTTCSRRPKKFLGVAAESTTLTAVRVQQEAR